MKTIVVLGHRSVDVLSDVCKKRVEKGVEMFNKDRNQIMVMSGGYALDLNKKNKVSEAELMKRYAVKLGVPDKKILKEELSRDTISNAYYTKQLLKRIKAKDIVVVSSEEHIPRVKLVFSKIYGSGFRLRYAKASGKNVYGREKGIEKEKLLIKATEKLLESVAHDDEAKIKEVIDKILKH